MLATVELGLSDNTSQVRCRPVYVSSQARYGRTVATGASLPAMMNSGRAAATLVAEDLYLLVRAP
jgi:hypothetical protein